MCVNAINFIDISPCLGAAHRPSVPSVLPHAHLGLRPPKSRSHHPFILFHRGLSCWVRVVSSLVISSSLHSFPPSSLPPSSCLLLCAFTSFVIDCNFNILYTYPLGSCSLAVKCSKPVNSSCARLGPPLAQGDHALFSRGQSPVSW